MARGSDINQRIVLQGADEVRRHLDEIAAAGQRSGNTTRAALLAATTGANSLTTGTRAATGSSRQMSFALQNLSFQVNDVATSLASGIDPMRTFAQQGGQIFQAFQQGGGLGTVLRAAGAGIADLITPMRVAAAGAVALAAGFALVVAHAVSSEDAARKFDVVLKGIGDTGTTTGKELETAAENLRDVGLSTSEARKQLFAFTQQGGRGRDAEKVVRIGKELNTVLGEGSLEKFISAAATGGPPLQEFATRLHIVSQSAEEVVASVQNSAATVSKSTQVITDAFSKRNRDIADEERQNAQQIADLTRKRGTAKQELELSSERRIIEINRQANREVIDLLRQRAKDNAQALAEFNRQTEIAAQKALDTGKGLVDQIGRRVLGSFRAAEGVAGKSLTDVAVAWDTFVNSLANSGPITQLIAALESMVASISKLVQGEFSIQALGVVLLAAIPALAAFRVAVTGITASLGPVGLILAIVGVVAAFVDWGKAWEGAQAAADGFWTFLKALAGWLSDTFFGILDQLAQKTNASKTAVDDLRNATARGGAFSGDPSIPAMPFAAGGMVRGPGSGTSDSIMARLSNGEFVMPALPTRMFLPQLEAMRSLMRGPIMPRSRSMGFAMGGLVASGAGGGSRTPINLHIGGEVFGVEADAATAQRVIRFGRKKAMLSAGKRPSTA